MAKLAVENSQKARGESWSSEIVMVVFNEDENGDMVMPIREIQLWRGVRHTHAHTCAAAYIAARGNPASMPPMFCRLSFPVRKS